jgi:DNA-binding transcriptional LysR family regulator
MIQEKWVLGRSHVLPIVAEFQRAFPHIRVRLQLMDRYVNLVEEQVDLAVRIGGLADSSMIVTRLGLIRRVVCASPAYLKARGVPKEPADLASHDCVTFDPTPWEFRRNGATQTIDVPSRLAVNLGEVAAAAAVAGSGISRVLSYLIEDLLKSRSLVALLDAYEPSPMPVSILYPGQRHVPLKLRAFLDFAVPRLRKRFGYPST